MKKIYAFAFVLTLSLIFNFLAIYKKVKYEFRSTSTGKSHTFNRQLIHSVLPIGKKDIVFVGDSHTQFFNLSEFFKNCNIKNRGIMGDVTEGVLDRILNISKQKPDKIFLQIGINDFWHDKLSVNEAVLNYEQIIKVINRESPKTKIYIQSVLPTTMVGSTILVEFNSRISKLDGKYIDLYTPFNKNGALISEFDCGDKIHLSGAGYVKWHEIINKYVTE